MKWIDSMTRYCNGKDLICAGVKVGSVFWDGMQPRDSALHYRGSFYLADRSAHFTTEAEAMKSVERMAQSFIRMLASDVEMEAK